jgi:hypothetical protein
MTLDLQNFSRVYMENVSIEDRRTLLIEMSKVFSQVISDDNFNESVMKVIEELRKVGHDLWSFDEDDDFQSWCGNWTKENGGKLVLEFHKYNPVLVNWSYNE